MQKGRKIDNAQQMIASRGRVLPAGGARARIVSDNQRQAREEVTAGDITEKGPGASLWLLANKSSVLAFLGFQKGFHSFSS